MKFDIDGVDIVVCVCIIAMAVSCAIIATANSGHAAEHEPPNERIRPAFIEVNQRMGVLCSHVGVTCNYVNVGSAPNAGDGDTIMVAAQKIADDLRMIDARVAP